MNNEKNFSGNLSEKKIAVQVREINRESMDNELFYPCGVVEQLFK